MYVVEKQEIEQALLTIFRMGDRDEMSWKHLGHGLAALIAYGDWRKAVDYGLPGYEVNEERLAKWWELIRKHVEKIGEQGVLDWLPKLEATRGEFLYLNNYITTSWLPYYPEIVAKGLFPREGRY